MMMRFTIRLAAALSLLVLVAGIGVPCVHAGGPAETSVSAAGSPLVPGDPSADACHCICHVTWIPVRAAACCEQASPGTISQPASSEPESCWLSPPGEPPRQA